jgi:hypothetical protein
MARGINLAEDAHVVPLISPGSITGGVSGLIFGMCEASKANILIHYGALAAAPGTVTLSACTNQAGAGATPVAFDLYQQTSAGAGNDVFGARQSITAAGYTAQDVPGTIDLIHIQADELPPGSPYLLLTIGDGTNADYVSAEAILTGVRYQGISNQTATV